MTVIVPGIPLWEGSRPDVGSVWRREFPQLLTNQAMNAVASLRTIELDVRSLGALMLEGFLTRGGAATDIQVTWGGSTKAVASGGTPHYGTGHSESTSAGVGTNTPFTRKFLNISADYNFMLPFPVNPLAYVKIIIACSNATADDVMNLYASGSVRF